MSWPGLVVTGKAFIPEKAAHACMVLSIAFYWSFGRKLIRSGIEDAELLACSELVTGGLTQIYLLYSVGKPVHNLSSLKSLAKILVHGSN